MKKLQTSRINESFDAVAAQGRLYLPLENDSSVNFGVYAPGAKYDPTVLHTVKSAKDVFFPQCESMVSFMTKDKTFTVTPVAPLEEQFTVFGVRACDVRGFELLDKVFLTDPVDNFYAARREHGTVISVACAQPEETCFCGTFGIDMTAPGGDVRAFWTEEYVYFAPLTQKGTALLDSVAGLLEEADDTPAPVEEQRKEAQSIMKKLPLASLTTEGWGAGKLHEKFDRPEWDELSAACIGCGTCTFVCPTCQCYDVRDYKAGDKVSRYRCWDSCMYNDFTMMAHGTNRPTQKQRFRQRFMHKLVYFPDNNDGAFSCVGCGRCVAKCPISMNIVKVMKAMGGKNND